jgi:alkyl sulfatase BDS1-like metallo-beta-lactamase superfamily hydrolase
MDLVTLTKSEEAKRLVPLLGGAEEVRKQAKAALDADDPRWAARLATYAMKVDSDDSEAKKIRQDAFLRIARTTMSANERNYLLTTINEENGKINWKAMFSKGDYKAAKTQELDHLLKLMKARFRAEAADNLKFIVKVTVSGQSPRYYQVRNNVLILRDKAPGKADATLSMDRDVLDRIVANMTTWSEALADKQIKVISGNSTVKQLAALIE